VVVHFLLTRPAVFAVPSQFVLANNAHGCSSICSSQVQLLVQGNVTAVVAISHAAYFVIQHCTSLPAK
jgi:hypothetical protein